MNKSIDNPKQVESQAIVDNVPTKSTTNSDKKGARKQRRPGKGSLPIEDDIAFVSLAVTASDGDGHVKQEQRRNERQKKIHSRDTSKKQESCNLSEGKVQEMRPRDASTAKVKVLINK